ncbi:GNAT family N-acetyltransferase [Candidatus Cyrtobacter comes]|uniref:GNAT family N-acetyltransferase n=1 Tax=Candidatus Cyrtobacter comes TaxID=675776 RepID=A0ABU5L791_9RICK|nr:GNAT family N-acetyltransferase [Candidatus Cyrtobacter comes]MDZ5762001.1 GNAT family N-acetyltransferase [Candidatus Cyrtobacter comes]
MNNIAKTQNLIIREIADTDFEALFNLLSNKEVMRYSVRGPYSKEQTKDWMLFILERYKKYPLGIWAVTEKNNDVPIGICGFIPLEEDDTQYEISYRLLPHFQGKGFATEAAMAVRDYAAGIEINEFIAFVDPENKPSIKVAEKIGMRFLRNDTYKGIPVVLYKYEHSKVKE